MAGTNKQSLQILFNHIEETQATINNETKLLQFIIRNKRNYHRGRIRFRHLIEVWRKHKRIASKWKLFAASIKNSINSKKKMASLLSHIDNVGRDTKSFIDIIIKCVGSFINEYIQSGHDINFCYLTIAILGRLYSVYLSLTSQMAQTRKTLFLFANGTNASDYSDIYWNDFDLFVWPKQMINCKLCTSAKQKMKRSENAMNLNQFGEQIGSKQMEDFIKQIHKNNYAGTQNVKIEKSKDEKIKNKEPIKKKICNDRSKIIGKKRRFENSKKIIPQKKKKRTKVIGSTFDLLPKSDKLEENEAKPDEIDEIFGDLGW